MSKIDNGAASQVPILFPIYFFEQAFHLLVPHDNRLVQYRRRLPIKGIRSHGKGEEIGEVVL